MKIAKYLGMGLVIMTSLYACETPKVAQKPVEEKPEVLGSDDLIINMLDSVDASELKYDGTGDGVFRRKIIYRDMSAAKSAIYVSGRVDVKVCINREGIVKYAEVLKDSSTIKDVKALKSFLKASCGYKFQPNPDAPKYECGKMSFRIQNSTNRTFR